MEGAETVRHIRSAGRLTHRSNSTSTSASVDDNISLSSSYSGVFKRSPYAPRSSAGDHTAVRTSAGISRMRYGRGRRKGSMFPSEQGGFSDVSSPKGSHRMSIYSLGNLAEVGIKVRRRRKSTMDSWGRNRRAGETKYFDEMLTPVELFRRAVKLVQMFASLCQYKYEKDYEENLAHTVFTQYINEHENQMEAELAFDVSFFKANRKMRVSAEVKSILSLLPYQRTEAQLAKVLFSLRSIRSFAEYPQRIQQKLVKVGWFETHETKRAILRQGHIPQAFYFVLSGSAVVTIMEELETFARTVHFLRRGDSFGELAILHDTRRQSSVISREPIELLVISKEDFVDIFMLAGGIKNLNDPDHQKFIKNIEFLKGWPIQLMAVNPKKCLFHFFRSGSVLVKDSNHSDWIYIIKSGSCQVLKKLREVKSCLTRHNDRVVGFENVKSQVPKATSRDRLERVRTKLSVVTLLLPKLHLRQGLITHMSDSEDDSGNETKNVDGLVIDKVAAAQKDGCSSEEKSPRIVGFRASLPQNGVRKGIVIAPRSSTAFDSELAGKTLNDLSDVRRKLSSEPVPIIHGIKNTVHDEDFSVTYSELPSRLRKRMATDEGEKGFKKLSLPTVLEEESTKTATQGPRLSPLQPELTAQGQRPKSDTNSGSRRLSSTTQSHTSRTSKVRSKSTVLPPKAQELADEEMSLPRHKISVIDEGEQRPAEIRITEADLHPMFVQVALLSKGDTFGVSSIVFDEQPSLSLVSNGAECIMISKKFYLSHCTDAMKRRLLVTETPYPNDDSLQKSLQDKVNWDAYRRKTMKSLIRELPTTSKRTKDLMVHRQTRRNMSLGADLKEAIRKIQVKEEDT